MAKLDALRKTEDFNYAEQGKVDSEPSIRYYDYDFTIFFKDAYGTLKGNDLGIKNNKKCC